VVGDIDKRALARALRVPMSGRTRRNLSGLMAVRPLRDDMKVGGAAMACPVSSRGMIERRGEAVDVVGTGAVEAAGEVIRLAAGEASVMVHS